MDRINEKLNEFKLPIGLLLVGGVLLVGGLFSSNLIQKQEASKEFPKQSIISQSNLNDLKIDVAGAVNNPGVFTLSNESRIEDVIKMAGGFSDKVSREYVSKRLNLSQKISDGLKIYIPFEGEEANGQVAGVSAQGKVGINSGDQASIESLPGIGAVTAKKIIDNRPYASLEELLSKKAVSKSVYTKILELVDLN